jgi:hypothetical protein
MPALRAPRASQLSRVSCQPRGPDNSQSMSRALTDALTADFSAYSEDLFGYSAIGCLMLLGMRNDQPKETWQTIGDLARALAAKLRATREETGATAEAGRGNSGATAGESRRPAQGPKARATVAIGGTSPAGSDDYASPGNIATGNNLEFATLVAPGRTATGPSLVMAPQGPVADHQHTPPASAICAAS